ncbi:cell division protein FtsZ [Candidatus Uhrbacteria bacterium]|nr:cell division protein FtsZ [Candidatus Uhrbacteria bacterium]
MGEVKPKIDTFAKIKVIGVGGSGGSALNRMIRAKLHGVEFIAANTDIQALHQSLAPMKVHLGKAITRGLGAGMDPEVGKKAAEESQNEIREALKGTDMVFVTCGLGGGTGSGAGPPIAEIARELGCLTIGVVTKPFSFEGAQRSSIAERAHEDLRSRVDALITIPNDRILSIIDKKTTLLDAFEIVDDILKQGVRGIAELITTPGLINVDFADVKAIMRDAGSALMGIGAASGENRAVEAARAAVSSPLLEISIEGARGILFTVAGGPNLTMHEVNEAAKIITGSADPNAKIIFGTIIDESLKEELRVTVVATGFDPPAPGKPIAKPDVAFLERQPPYRPPKYFGKNEEPAATGKAPERASPAPATTAATVREIPRAYGDDFLEEEPEPVAATPAVNDDLEIPAFIRRKLG